MIRIAAMIAGLLLIVCPALWLIEVSVHLPKYRKGGYADFLFVGRLLLAIYGGVLLGVAVYWVRANRSGQSLFPIEMFKAGIYGVLIACIVFFGGASLYGITKYGSADKAIGNLWGMLVIFWGILGALVSAGMALLSYARRSPAGAGAGQGPWSSPPRIPK
jgi:hypothetical protein